MTSNNVVSIVSKPSPKCQYGKKGWPKCHCTHCLNEISEYAEFKKGQRFLLRGILIEIVRFCPLEHCCPICVRGIMEKDRGFVEWFTLEEARQQLQESYQIKEFSN